MNILTIFGSGEVLGFCTLSLTFSFPLKVFNLLFIEQENIKSSQTVGCYTV